MYYIVSVGKRFVSEIGFVKVVGFDVHEVIIIIIIYSLYGSTSHKG